MVKLVILNQGMNGRVFELNVDRTTVGRVEENTFQIGDPSVSSRHAEIIRHGSEILVRDLNSTNGSFINGEKISEAVLQPGQILRLGQVELKLDDGQPISASTSSAPAPVGSSRKTVDATMVIPRGVSLNDLEQSGGRPSGFDTNKSFSPKTNHTNKYFLIIGIVVGLIIIVLIAYALKKANG